jgi:hypothetical protein
LPDEVEIRTDEESGSIHEIRGRMSVATGAMDHLFWREIAISKGPYEYDHITSKGTRVYRAYPDWPG